MSCWKPRVGRVGGWVSLAYLWVLGVQRHFLEVVVAEDVAHAGSIEDKVALQPLLLQAAFFGHPPLNGCPPFAGFERPTSSTHPRATPR